MAGSRRVTATVSTEIEWLQTAHDWPGLKAIGNWRLDVVMNEDQDRTGWAMALTTWPFSATWLSTRCRRADAMSEGKSWISHSEGKDDAPVGA
jgi:hypothetical protein